MVTKVASYVCDTCGGLSKKWSGKCLHCGTWNAVREQTPAEQRTPIAESKAQEVALLDTAALAIQRINTGYAEVDQVLGGGLVIGSVLLIGGDPGVGKSTLVMQLAHNISSPLGKTLYVSGEESMEQIKLRAQRMGINNHDILLLSCSDLQDIMATVNRDPKIRHLVIDSIQTVKSSASDGAMGSMSQVKHCAQELSTFAKSYNITTIIIGHITKEGALAGPKMLEHMVDAVLYFEGEKNYQFRVLRSIKNRYGPSNEIGIFRMIDSGLEEVLNPSVLFMAGMDNQSSGSVVFAGIEGNRPLLMEIQALVAPTYMAYPRRTIVGWDSNRLDMILAVLHARYKLQILDKEVYLNVVGGIRTQEPGADLAVALALISSARDVVLRHRYVAFGEIGLGGEVRPVAGGHIRVREAIKVGMNNIVVAKSADIPDLGANVIRIGHISDLRSIIE